MLRTFSHMMFIYIAKIFDYFFICLTTIQKCDIINTYDKFEQEAE